MCVYNEMNGKYKIILFSKEYFPLCVKATSVVLVLM